MSFPRYGSYRESGIEWLREVPSHWEVVQNRRIITVQSGDMIAASDETESGYPIIGGNGIRGYTDRSNSRGDTLVIGRVGALCGCVHHITTDFWASEHAYRVVERKPINKRFFFHLLTALDLNRFAIKTAQPLLNTSIVEDQWIALPSLQEQTSIAAFLDRETARIDALVAEQQRLIELLKEKRQAVISQAVTKGLDPNVPMKDSGIEWLGEVPAHWEAWRLKHLSPCVTVGIVVEPTKYISGEGLPFTYGGDISEGQINYTWARRISPENSQKQPKTMLREGDLLTVRVGAPGVTAVVPRECDGGNCASVMLVRRGPRSSDWLCYAMNSRPTRFQVEVVQYGAAQEQFNISHAVNFVFATPPVEEAEMIARWLNVKTGQITALIDEALSAISLLQERRAALISAAVTGKIDIRGHVPAQAEAA